MKPGLYIVSTPIGNLEDISIRAEETLKNVEIIVCENPKHSLKLFAKLGIKKKLYSLDGEPPSLIEPISGCSFASRCPKPTNDCKNGDIDMELIEVSDNHWVDQCCVKCG